MNRITKLSLTLGTPIVLFALAAGSVFAADTNSFTKAKVDWNTVGGVKNYNIYYKETGQKKWTHAVRSLPQNARSYTISYLKNGVSYQYEVSAVNYAGKEFWMSGVKNLK